MRAENFQSKPRVLKLAKGQNQDPNRGLGVSYPQCVLLSMLPFPCLPSTWFLQVSPFTLGFYTQKVTDILTHGTSPFQEKTVCYDH